LSCLIIFPAIDLSCYTPTLQELELLEAIEQNTGTEIIEKNALLYVAGYVAHRFRNTYNNLGVPTKTLPAISDDWVSFKSRGNFMYPTTELEPAANIMNFEFEKFHGNFLNKEPWIFDKLIDIICTKTNNNFPRAVIACLVRTRTYIRLRKLNKEIVENNILKKKSKKISKISNKKNPTYIR